MASEPQNWPDVSSRTGHSYSRFSRWLLERGKRLWRPLGYSSAYLALIATVEVLVVQHLLSLPLTPAPVVVGLLTFSIYVNDRLVDRERDAESNPRRTAFVRRHGRALYTLAAVAYGLAVALSALGGPVAFGLALVPGAVWVLYALEWDPAYSLPLGRLKEVLVLNSALVAAAWSLVVVLLPVTFADAVLTPAALVVLSYFVLATFVNTEIANVGDVEADRNHGVSTIPTAFGVARTRQILYGITLLAAAVLAYATAAGYLGAVSATALVAGLVCLGGVTLYVGRAENERLLAIAAECTRLPVFVLLAAPTVVG